MKLKLFSELTCCYNLNSVYLCSMYVPDTGYSLSWNEPTLATENWAQLYTLFISSMTYRTDKVMRAEPCANLDNRYKNVRVLSSYLVIRMDLPFMASFFHQIYAPKMIVCNSSTCTKMVISDHVSELHTSNFPDATSWIELQNTRASNQTFPALSYLWFNSVTWAIINIFIFIFKYEMVATSLGSKVRRSHNLNKPH